MNKRNQVITVISDNYMTSGSIYHRFLSPLKYLDAVYGIRYNPVTKLSEMPEEYVKNSRAIQFSNIISLPIKKEDGTFDFSNIVDIVVALKDDAGLKIVLDIDDLWELNDTHPNKAYFDSVGYSEAVKLSIQLADVVITTNTTLANHIKSHNSNVFVIPTVISKLDKQFVKYKTDSDRVRYGYVASSSHLDDLDIFDHSSLVDDSMIMFPCNLEDSTAKMMFDKLNKYNQCYPLELRDVFSYGQLYRDIDISISVLKDNIFNRAKSNLKWLEANAVGCPLLEIGLEMDKTLPDEKAVARQRYKLFKEL